MDLKLPDSQVFSKDIEKWDKEDIEEMKKRIKVIVERLRNARAISQN